MVNHIQTIRRQKPRNCLSMFDHFIGLALKGLTTNSIFLENIYGKLLHINGFSCDFMHQIVPKILDRGKLS